MTADIAAAKAALSHLDSDDHPQTVRQKSRDFYWYSPILKPMLDDVVADFVVAPRSEAEVIEVLATCYRFDVPVTVRGGGTGNYGQAMPLAGGCVLHMRHMDRVTAITDDHLICETGAIIADIERQARVRDREIRLFPSTTATATIGGFIAGGSSGVGAIRWGGLRTPGNIRRVRLVTMEETPRIVELQGEDIFKAAHAYGVNGVMTEIEIPVDPAGDWVDMLIGTEDFAAATRLAFEIGNAGHIAKRMLSTFEPDIPARYFTRHAPFLKEGEALVAVMAARGDLNALAKLAADHGASVRFRADRDGAGKRLPPAYEIAWNHTTLRALKIDPDTTTYLQMMLPPDNLYAAIDRVKAAFGDELLLHSEFTRFSGRVSAVFLPLVRYRDNARLEELMLTLERDFGVTVFNPHRLTLEEGGMKRTDLGQLAFKRETDPKGLMNPGKMIAWTNPDWRAEPGKAFLFTH
ncbi:FAD-binding oxidoreductase [Martelella sp. HB161492]|uniref:FAD-binding oxidoreductase n=1 Tax=Martelella sp. HB161492 TaxID=2720726 RepID=UPI00158FFF3A|nr:FAD-binding oxidoreductase [Martelella sp. HB161492]